MRTLGLFLRCKDCVLPIRNGAVDARQLDRMGGDGRKGTSPALLPALGPREESGNYFGKRNLEKAL